MPVRRKKERQKGLRVSDFALSLVVFKWHHGSGSEGVNELGHKRSQEIELYRNGNQTSLLISRSAMTYLILSDNPVSEPSLDFEIGHDLILSDNPVSEPSFWFRDRPWPNSQW